MWSLHSNKMIEIALNPLDNKFLNFNSNINLSFPLSWHWLNVLQDSSSMLSYRPTEYPLKTKIKRWRRFLSLSRQCLFFSFSPFVFCCFWEHWLGSTDPRDVFSLLFRRSFERKMQIRLINWSGAIAFVVLANKNTCLSVNYSEKLFVWFKIPKYKNWISDNFRLLPKQIKDVFLIFIVFCTSFRQAIWGL